MHPTLLVVKRSEAIARIERAARKIANLAEIDPSIVAALTSTGNHPQVRELRRLEAIADILDAAIDKVDVTTVTEPTVPAQNAQDEEAAVPVDDASALPPPSLIEEPEAKPKPKPKPKRSRK